MDFTDIFLPFTLITLLLGGIILVFSRFVDIQTLGERVIAGNIDLAIFLSACAVTFVVLLTYHFMRKAEA